MPIGNVSLTLLDAPRAIMAVVVVGEVAGVGASVVGVVIGDVGGGVAFCGKVD